MRALLIGSGYGNYPVEASVDAVFTWLCGHGFKPTDVLRISGDAATRDTMLTGLDRLAEADPGDTPVVFYYAGHGHLYRTTLDVEGEGHSAHPLLVAIDLDASKDGTLRSVLGSELSRALQRVARRARNLTVILDCCHASGMARLDDDLDAPGVRAHERALHVEASARIAQHRAPVLRGGDPVAPPERLSERVVVLAASSAGGRAYPHPVTERLVFTDALLAALADHQTWDAVLADVRARVQAVRPTQYPCVFGPRFRRPFTLDEHLPAGELMRVEQHGANTVLLAGKLVGIHPADEFELLTCATTSPLPASILGNARPYAIQDERTILQMRARRIARPCYARRTRRGAPLTAAITSDDPARTLEISQLVRGAGFQIKDGEVGAHVELRAGVLRVRDCLGELVHAAPTGPLAADDLHRCLRRLDPWLGVSRWLRADSSSQPLRGCYSIAWGILDRTALRPIAGPVTARPGEVLALELHNLDRGAPELYIQAYRIRADREIRAWSSDMGPQHAAARQRTNSLHHAPGHAETLTEPPHLPPGRYCEWSLVLVSNVPFDSDTLETPVDARTLAVGLKRFGRSALRGDEDERMVDIVGFPYLLELPTDDGLT